MLKEFYYKYLELPYLNFRYEFLLETLWFDNILFFYRHHILHQRCQNCRNWQYEGRWQSTGREYGICKCNREFDDYHAHCPSWNEDWLEDERGATHLPDGWMFPTTTAGGRNITQISRNGRLMYLKDGEPKW